MVLRALAAWREVRGGKGQVKKPKTVGDVETMLSHVLFPLACCAPPGCGTHSGLAATSATARREHDVACHGSGMSAAYGFRRGELELSKKRKEPVLSLQPQ